MIRAGLTGALIAAADGVELTSGVGYVAADRCVDLPWARRYRVVEAMPLSTSSACGRGCATAASAG